MARIDARVLALLPLLLITGACGGKDPASPVVTPPSSVAAAPSTSAPAPPSAAATPGDEPEPSHSVFVEEDADPTPAPGDLSDEAQSYLDEALGTELGALESAPPAVAARKRETLNRLPENPSQVLVALRHYEWQSPQAKALYDKAAKS